MLLNLSIKQNSHKAMTLPEPEESQIKITTFLSHFKEIICGYACPSCLCVIRAHFISTPIKEFSVMVRTMPPSWVA